MEIEFDSIQHRNHREQTEPIKWGLDWVSLESSDWRLDSKSDQRTDTLCGALQCKKSLSNELSTGKVGGCCKR